LISELANDIESRSGTLHFLSLKEEQRLGGVLSCRCKAQEARFPLPEEKKSEHVTVNQWLLLGRP
jgi:hypothetical protein